jgi:hypothetical protein
MAAAPFAGILIFLFVVLALLVRISLTLTKLVKGELTVATFKEAMAQIDAALSAETQEETTLVAICTQVDKDVDTLLQKIADGQQVDVTAELTAIKANTATIATVVDAANKADQEANPGGPSDQGQVPPV